MPTSRPVLHTIRQPGQALRRNRQLSAGIVQLIFIAVAFAAGLAAPEIDAGFTVQGEDARAFLIAIGAGILPFIGIVYSLLFLVVQFGTTTFTPRLNIFRDSPIIYYSFAYFVGLLVFCFTAAFALGSDDEVSGAIPIITLGLVLIALALFRILQTSAFKSIQLAAALSQVASRGRAVILGIYPDELDEASAEQELHADWRAETPTGVREVRWSGLSAVLQVIDVPRLMKVAERENALIECRVGTGDTISECGVVALIHGEADGQLEREVLKSLRAGAERTFEQDPAFAFRVLADIALRALSPAVNDPTTASQALDTSDGLLRLLATRDLDVGCLRGPEGQPRVVLLLPAWDGYVGLALDEVLSIGLRSFQIRRRLERLLAELHQLVPPARRAAIEHRLERVRAAPAQDPATPAGQG